MRLALLLASTALAACLELSGPTDDIESLSSVLAPYPAAIVRDTLRDSLGVARRLEVIAFTGRGDSIRSPEGLAFFLPDTGTGARIENGYFIAGDAIGPVRVVAQVPGLQTAPLIIAVVPVPSQARAEPETLGNPATLAVKQYGFTTSATSQPLQVRVQGLANGTLTDVDGWIVRYVITRQPVSPVAGRLPATMEKPLRGDAAVSVDTTAGGIAARSVVLDPRLLANPADTVIVQAHVQYRGTAVPGSPIEFRVPFAP